MKEEAALRGQPPSAPAERESHAQPPSAPVDRESPAQPPSPPVEREQPTLTGLSEKAWFPQALIAALVVAGALALTFFALWLRSADTSADEVGRFLSSQKPQVGERASQVVNLFLNYDAANIETVSRRLLEMSTGTFRKEYESALNAKNGFGQALKKASASSRGRILVGPDVSFESATKAVVLARATQTVQNERNPTGDTYTLELRLGLVKTPEGWKANEVEVLSQRPG